MIWEEGLTSRPNTAAAATTTHATTTTTNNANNAKSTTNPAPMALASCASLVAMANVLTGSHVSVAKMLTESCGRTYTARGQRHGGAHGAAA
jgi:hypothetical protein